MKKYLFAAALGSLFMLNACSEKEPTATPEARGGELEVKVNFQANGNAVNWESMEYVTPAGDSVQLDLIRHYLSNFEFHSPETGWEKVEKYALVEYDIASSQTLNFKDLPFGQYDSVRFYMGLDSAINHNIDHFNTLDPAYNMLWTWNTGYIFIKYEGKFKNSNDVVVPFGYHIGADNYLMSYSLPISTTKALTVSNTKATINLNFELMELFDNPNLIKLNEVPAVSHTMDEPTFTMLLRDNLLNAWTAE
ncbi:MAG: hypothetical protein EP332_04455 [Bacteroidetes bacterium]|nr:MAG: hypothetical protein EP332_04455 [Bacteroidota bacterium]